MYVCVKENNIIGKSYSDQEGDCGLNHCVTCPSFIGRIPAANISTPLLTSAVLARLIKRKYVVLRFKPRPPRSLCSTFEHYNGYKDRRLGKSNHRLTSTSSNDGYLFLTNIPNKINFQQARMVWSRNNITSSFFSLYS